MKNRYYFSALAILLCGFLDAQHDATSVPADHDSDASAQLLAVDTSTLTPPQAVAEHDTVVFSVFPNPSNDIVMVRMPGRKNVRQVSMINTNGVIVDEVREPQEDVITFEREAAGLYIIVMQFDDGRTASNVVVWN